MSAGKRVRKGKHLQVILLPWLRLKGKVSVGKVAFWPYSLLKKESKLNRDVFAFLDRYVECYRQSTGEKIDDVTICTHGKSRFRRLPEEKRDDILGAVNALAFTSISTNAFWAMSGSGFHWGAAFSDPFQTFGHNLPLGTNEIGVMYPNFSAVLDMKSARFYMPPEAEGSVVCLEDELIGGLGRLLETEPDSDLARRINLSAEWFRMANTQMGGISLQAQLVMLATALETLLELPKGEKWKRLRIAAQLDQRIADHCNEKIWNGFRKQRRKPREFQGLGDCDRSLLGWWGYDFYELRNRIVHGDKLGDDELCVVDDSGKKVSQCLVAAVVLRHLVVAELFKAELLGLTARQMARKQVKAIQPSNAKQTFNELAWDNLHFLCGLYRPYQRLGWLVKGTSTVVHAGGGPRPRPSG